MPASLIVERELLVSKAIIMENNVQSFDSLDENVQQTSPRSSRKRKIDREHHAKVIKKRTLHSGDVSSRRKTAPIAVTAFAK